MTCFLLDHYKNTVYTVYAGFGGIIIILLLYMQPCGFCVLIKCNHQSTLVAKTGIQCIMVLKIIILNACFKVGLLLW